MIVSRGIARPSTLGSVKARLDGLPVGSVSQIWSADGLLPAGTFERTGAGTYRLIGRLKLWLLDASSGLSIGTSASDDIQALSGASLPTWGTAGDAGTGGLILDATVDAGYALRFVGEHSAEGPIAVKALMDATVTTAVDGLIYTAGILALAIDKIVAGGVIRDTGNPYRVLQYAARTAYSTLGGGSAAAALNGIDGDVAACSYAARTIGATCGVGSLVTQPTAGTGANQTSVATLASSIGGQTDCVAYLHAYDGGGSGDMSVRVSEIGISERTPS